LVEHPAGAGEEVVKVKVRKEKKSCCSSVVEHFLGKEEVVSSILINSSKEQLVWNEA
jgi:hypothetical protein